MVRNSFVQLLETVVKLSVINYQLLNDISLNKKIVFISN